MKDLLSTMIGLSLACYFAPVEPMLVIGTTITLGIFARCSLKFEHNIQPKLAVADFLASVSELRGDKDDETGSTREGRGRRLPEWLIRLGGPVGRVAQEEWGYLRESDLLATVRYYFHTAPLLALIAAFCLVGSAAGLATNPLNKPGPVIGSAQGSSAGQKSTEASANSATSVSSGVELSTNLPSVSIHTEWDGECPTETIQQGVSPRVIATFRRLYEEESGLLHQQEGCISQITTHRYHGEFYATTFGTNPVTGAQLSFAIDSEHYGPMIVLAPAASTVQGLITHLGPIGGVGRFPDYRITGSSDYYLLRSRHGMYVLLRRQDYEPYVTLTPTVARAWLGAMKEDREWLWPSVYGSEGTIQLSSSATGHAVGQITVTSTGEALRAGYRYHTHPSRELGLAELQTLAATAH